MYNQRHDIPLEEKIGSKCLNICYDSLLFIDKSLDAAIFLWSVAFMFIWPGNNEIRTLQFEQNEQKFFQITSKASSHGRVTPSTTTKLVIGKYTSNFTSSNWTSLSLLGCFEILTRMLGLYKPIQSLLRYLSVCLIMMDLWWYSMSVVSMVTKIK